MHGGEGSSCLGACKGSVHGRTRVCTAARGCATPRVRCRTRVCNPECALQHTSVPSRTRVPKHTQVKRERDVIEDCRGGREGVTARGCTSFADPSLRLRSFPARRSIRRTSSRAPLSRGLQGGGEAVGQARTLQLSASARADVQRGGKRGREEGSAFVSESVRSACERETERVRERQRSMQFSE